MFLKFGKTKELIKPDFPWRLSKANWQAMPILDLSVHSHYLELTIYGGKAT